MKVLVLGDSCGMPRLYKQEGFNLSDLGEIELTYDDVYPEQLRRMLRDFFSEDIQLHNGCAHATTSFQVLLQGGKDAYLYQPDYIVVHTGLVDCWDRTKADWAPFPEMLGRNPWISKDEYREYITSFLKFCFSKIPTVKAVVLVNTIRASDDQYKRHPGSHENTVQYNGILKEIALKDCRVFLADIYSIIDRVGTKSLCHDGVHPNSEGSRLIAKEILQVLRTVHCYNLGMKLFEEKRYKEAGVYLKNCTFEKIFCLLNSKEGRSNHKLNLGICAEETGDIQEAVKQYMTAFKENNQLQEALSRFFTIVIAREKPDDVIKFIERNIPLTQENLTLLAQVFTRHGNPDFVRKCIRLQQGE